ncbi:tryptophan--tRNA ligase, mitochondrial [Daktulosphaira vitifoliae]|uniref:tryptophan--tRNA ligase, mitochondrial n=1 Tax=Daktulosphaira vitifoliae TaxID=58002 RepID=UPI0021AA7451|nr:tryptophan--tRNA ligase, mitochondrial [Daktulosphaira vitifoliae]
MQRAKLKVINIGTSLKLMYVSKLFRFCHSKVSWHDRVFSGIQPTGTLHLGNYFGAVSKWVQLQNENKEVLLSIVDLHSITLPYDTNKLQNNILLMTASLLASGINPNKSVLFLQSQISEHTLLSWVLGCLTTMPRLGQLPQFKEKSSMLKDVPLGLYLYPVLQAADILLYKATKVPVGEDQVQHLQLAHALARSFNTRYGVTFPIPEILVQKDSSSRIRNLRDPTKKMSKSHPDQRGRIEITDSSDVIAEKIKKAVTDCISEVTYDPENRPGVSALVAMHSFVTGSLPEKICEENSFLDTGRYKQVVSEILIEKFSPIRQEIFKLMASPDYLFKTLEEGRYKASSIAEKTWSEVASKIGSFPSNTIKCSSSNSKIINS